MTRYLIIALVSLLGCGDSNRRDTVTDRVDTLADSDPGPSDTATTADGVATSDIGEPFDSEATPDAELSDIPLDTDILVGDAGDSTDATLDDSSDTSSPDDITDTSCDRAPEWSRSPRRAGGSVTFNELAIGASSGWVELSNPQAIDIDLTGWRLEGSIGFAFPPGTFAPARGLLLIAADPTAPPTALGPWSGPSTLTSAGSLKLVNNAGRVMDAIDWASGSPWPSVRAGHTLHKPAPESWSALAESWSESNAPGGTPDMPNMPIYGGRGTLVPNNAIWRQRDVAADDNNPSAEAPDFDDGGWEETRAPFIRYAQTPLARFTADNHFALYLGGPAGENLRFVGRDSDGDWTSVETFALDAAPREHLWIAAWEGPGDGGSPQMLIGEIERPDGPPMPTAIETLDVVLAPAGLNPGDALSDPPPAIASLLPLAANSASFRPLAVDADKFSGPWGGSIGEKFAVGRFVWSDSFDSNSETNQFETFALFRTRSPVTERPQSTSSSVTTWFRTTFDLGVEPALVTKLLATLEVGDGAVVYLNGEEVYRTNLPLGSLEAHTLALSIRPNGQRETFELPKELLVDGSNIIAVEVHLASPSSTLKFSLALEVEAESTSDSHDEPLTGEVVISELMVKSLEDELGRSTGDWLELYNRSDRTVDIGGWTLVDALRYTVPDGTLLEAGGYLVIADDPDDFHQFHPNIDVLGPFSGNLSSDGERLVLRDRCGLEVDVVRYASEGRWRGRDGSSFELRDPGADNASPEAWAPSEESENSSWQTIQIRGPATPSSVGPDGLWHELVLGLLTEGEVLIDDVEVIADPDGKAENVIAGGDFEGELEGWQMLGTHEESRIIEDPSATENHVLKIVATGPTEHMHNHIAVTFRDGIPIIDGQTYDIRLRAKWLNGGNQLNTRLYFNRLAWTTRLKRPVAGGTPGRKNGAAIGNIGPTFDELRLGTVVPRPGESTRLTITAHDPDGLESLVVWTDDGLERTETPMSFDAHGQAHADLPAFPKDTVVQFWVEGVDSLGATSTFPSDGEHSRALFVVDEPLAPTAMHSIRLVMTQRDSDRFVSPTEVMSNADTRATLIYDERVAYYDVGVRAKGSERGRPEVARLGFHVSFDPLMRLRGVLSSVSIDRSEGVITGQRELLTDIAMANAGSVAAEYNEPIHLIAPRPEHSGFATLQTGRFGDIVLDNQFPNGSDGTVFEYELIYHPYTTDNGLPTGRKMPQPDGVVGASLRPLGSSMEDYRHIFLLKNNRSRDDFSPVMRMCAAFATDAPNFETEIRKAIDVDQWLRSFALMALAGAVDHYGDGAQHNVQMYERPSDKRVLLFPHDLDFVVSPYGAVIGQYDLVLLLGLPGAQRTFYESLYDFSEFFSNPSLEHAANQLGALLGNQPFASHLAFFLERVRYISEDAPDGILASAPPTEFAILTPDATRFPRGQVVIQGQGWLDIRAIDFNGISVLPDWYDTTRFEFRPNLSPGEHLLEFEAIDRNGLTIAQDDVIIFVE